jgi:aminopeptidase N
MQDLYTFSKYKAAEQDDLWHHLTQQAHKDGTLPEDVSVKAIMDTWTLQMGFPVVNVKRNYDDNSATVSQVSARRMYLAYGANCKYVLKLAGALPGDGA